ncbi:MAG TPA: glycoside hydrolase family 2 protein [Ruminiclostridium sp.]
MKTCVALLNDWWLRQASPSDFVDSELSIDRISNENLNDKFGWYYSNEALSVHEILLECGVLDEEIRLGKCNSCVWVAENDWIYCKAFNDLSNQKGSVNLVFKGLDTIVDVYLNGSHIGFNSNMFLPLKINITDYICESNRLVLHFHSPYKVMDGIVIPEGLQGYIKPKQMIRKAHLDYEAYLGVTPYLTPIGIFDDVYLEYWDKAILADVDISARFSLHYEDAFISVKIKVKQIENTCICKISIYNNENKIVAYSGNLYFVGDVLESKELNISNPELWWPKNYGSQPLYQIKVELFEENLLIDSCSKNIGLRKIEQIGDMRFKVNGTEIKMWGSNFVPPYCISHRWLSERSILTLELAKNANMNMLRIWGEGVPYSDELYDYCDKEGILLWQDFFVWYGFSPDDEASRENYKAECAYMIRRLKHHPSLLLWCGGNESYMYICSKQARGKQFGYAVYEHDIANLCKELDGERCYIVNSPYGGNYPNDALGGDTHYYNGADYNAGIEYPVFVTENCYTTALSKKSMLRFMTEQEIFPDNFTDVLYPNMDNPYFKLTKDRVSFRYWRNLPVPETWRPHMDEYAHCEFWGIDNFYNANSVDSILHKYSACAAEYYKTVIEKQRCGYPSYDHIHTRRTQGHLSWKLNDAFPSINFTLIDAFMEPTAAYFSIKRAYQPVILSIEISDHINIWGVNDTNEDVSGILNFRLFSRFENEVVKDFSVPVFIYGGKSKVFTTLNQLGSVSRECVMHAELIAGNGKVIAGNIQVFEHERDISFPDAKLCLEMVDGDLVITTDKYAHYVELCGNDNEDEFGWYFDDNYFDLLPFETKVIKVSGKHTNGTITAKPYFSSLPTTLNYTL